MNLLEAEKMANQLIHKHLNSQGEGYWRFRFDNAKRRYGCCHYKLRLITMSKSLLKLMMKMKSEIRFFTK